MTFLILLYFETEISAIPNSFQFVQLFDFSRYIKNNHISSIHMSVSYEEFRKSGKKLEKVRKSGKKLFI